MTIAEPHRKAGNSPTGRKWAAAARFVLPLRLWSGS